MPSEAACVGLTKEACVYFSGSRFFIKARLLSSALCELRVALGTFCLSPYVEIVFTCPGTG